MLSRTQQRSHQQGFTLVELAIVLVIIGLIVGGVLVGQDLIKSAEVRATISQVEKFNAAATAFRDKFGGLPGDLIETRANQFGLTPLGRGAPGLGDGNGLIQSSQADLTALQGETHMFWSDLSQASLISESVTALALDAVGAFAQLPTSRMRESAIFHVYSFNGRNFFYLGALATPATPAVSAGISPFQAFSIDQKLDNGNGSTGIVVAVSDTTNTLDAGAAAAPATGECMGDEGLYNTVPAEADSILCSLAIRSSF